MSKTLIALSLALALPALAKPAGSSKFKYTVVKGDTAECLEKKYGIVPGELSAMNGGRPDVMTYKLVVGKTLNVPVRVPKNACKGFAVTSGEKGADHSLKDKACMVIDRTRQYAAKEAIKLLTAINHNPACLKAAEIAAQPGVSQLCEAVGHLLHSHHATHGIATSIEFLCEAAHLTAHQIHEQAGHEGHGSTHAKGSHAAPASHHAEE